MKLRHLGKEDLLIDLYKHFKKPIFVSNKRYDRYIIDLELDDQYFSDEFEDDTLIFIEDADQKIQFTDEFNEFLEKRHMIYIEPSALNYSIDTRPANIYEFYAESNGRYFKIPYTDHSSPDEITKFVQKLQPKRLIPIVQKKLKTNKVYDL